MGVRGVLGAGRDSRYSGARRGIGALGDSGVVRSHFWGIKGVGGVLGAGRTVGTKGLEGV